MSNKYQNDLAVQAKKYRRYLLIVLMLLVFSVASNFAMGFISGNKVDKARENPYSLLDPARNLIAQKDFIVNIQPLRVEMKKLVSEQDYKVSIYFEILNTGANISINQDERIFPASMSKLPLALAVVKKVENAKWKWNNELVLLEEDRDMGYGQLFRQPIGTRFTIEHLVKEALVNSDNTAYRILLRNMEGQELEDMLASIGLEELFTAEGKISAKEYSRIFRALYTSSYLKRENSQLLLNWLSQTPLNDYLAASLPDEGVVFAHKIGEGHEQQVYSDAGIVYMGNRAYIITVMVHMKGQEDGEAAASEFMRKVSNLAYEYVKAQ